MQCLPCSDISDTIDLLQYYGIINCFAYYFGILVFWQNEVSMSSL